MGFAGIRERVSQDGLVDAVNDLKSCDAPHDPGDVLSAREAQVPSRAEGAALALTMFALAGCHGAQDPGADPVFPADLSAWAEGRPCAFTHEHELRYIRVLCDEAANAPYRELSEAYPYPVGATLVKLEYDDSSCTNLIGYTAMQKQASEYSSVGNDWRWQRVTVDRQVTEDGELNTCITCHEHHCTWPECGYERCGYDLTCGKEE